MKITRMPIIMVRRVGKYKDREMFEYYIQQGNKKINFFIDRSTHEELQRAQALAVLAPEKQPGAEVQIPLRVVGDTLES